MRQRAEAVGGTLDLRSGDAGTTITATLPVILPLAPSAEEVPVG